MPLPGLGEKKLRGTGRDIYKNYKWNGGESFTAALLKVNLRPDYFKNRHLQHQSFKLAFDFSHWDSLESALHWVCTGYGESLMPIPTQCPRIACPVHEITCFKTRWLNT